MSEEYTVYKYIPNEEHENQYKELTIAKHLSNTNKIDFGNKDMLIKWIYHYLVTFGKVKLYALYTEKDLVHYSFYIPYCYKFSFMKKGDYVIGPCWTSEDFRGNRIYPITISKIALDITRTNANSNVYLLIRPNNASSTNAIIHTEGWTPVGTICKTRFKNYKSCEWN